MIEEWAIIQGSDNAYASTLGRIKRNGVVLRQYRDSEGYMRVSVGGNVGRKRVHTLVLSAFKRQEPGRTCVNHRNGKKDDNRLNNLEWSTPRENSMYAALRGAWKYPKQARRIKAIRLEDGEIFYYRSQNEAAEQIGINNSEINKMLHGKRRTCHGYIFEYLEEVKPRRVKNGWDGQLTFDFCGGE